MIRLAREQDLPRIFEVYAVARQLMRESGNPRQWGDHFPPHDLLRSDIPKKQLYVVERDGVIHAAFALVFGEDPSYGYIEGVWRSDAPYAAIHRVGSDGTGGIFAEVIAFCREKSPYLRIDTHHDNHRLSASKKAMPFLILQRTDAHSLALAHLCAEKCFFSRACR